MSHTAVEIQFDLSSIIINRLAIPTYAHYLIIRFQEDLERQFYIKTGRRIPGKTSTEFQTKLFALVCVSMGVILKRLNRDAMS